MVCTSNSATLETEFWNGVGSNYRVQGQWTMGTDNPIVDENDEEEKMNDVIEQQNEETNAEVNDDGDANIDGDADDMIEEENSCIHSYIFPQLDDIKMGVAEEEFQLMKRKGKEKTLSIHVKSFKKPLIFQYLTVKIKKNKKKIKK